ncbi:MAG: 3-hydroxyacyl-ACP dehydratase FabZ [Candidatus Omnitrophica bacterium]|nr:3-hydroxyacyl-ACP dehydratase FabZ [Candidatus Omnitrophota bacterium]
MAREVVKCPDGRLDINDIKKILPHRYPMLLVDKIVEFEEDKRIVGIKNITANEPFFEGHFPDNPIMPGVLIVEAMAQVGGVLMFNKESNLNKPAFFLGVDNARFRKAVIPGDILTLEIEVLKLKTRVAQLHGKARVESDIVAEADIMFGFV